VILGGDSNATQLTTTGNLILDLISFQKSAIGFAGLSESGLPKSDWQCKQRRGSEGAIPSILIRISKYL
jgi:hypothetical protein